MTTTADIVADDGECSLGEAVLAANGTPANDDCPAGAGGDEILLVGGATYTLAIAGAFEDAAETGDLDIVLGTIVRSDTPGVRATVDGGGILNLGTLIAVDPDLLGELSSQVSALSPAAATAASSAVTAAVTEVESRLGAITPGAQPASPSFATRELALGPGLPLAGNEAEEGGGSRGSRCWRSRPPARWGWRCSPPCWPSPACGWRGVRPEPGLTQRPGPGSPSTCEGRRRIAAPVTL
ncbi:MAG TPA: CSLREA domain-containing protein [Thermoanaerobaculia bacterium]|nr:CSLREA domain-containing protein [Thermoanaerobaculia bacterium]